MFSEARFPGRLEFTGRASWLPLAQSFTVILSALHEFFTPRRYPTTRRRVGSRLRGACLAAQVRVMPTALTRGSDPAGRQ